MASSFSPNSRDAVFVSSSAWNVTAAKIRDLAEGGYNFLVMLVKVALSRRERNSHFLPHSTGQESA